MVLPLTNKYGIRLSETFNKRN